MLITERMEDAVCCFSPDGKITYANKPYLLGTKKVIEKERQNKFILSVSGEYGKQFSEELKNISLKKPSFSVEQQIDAGKGNKISLEWLIKGTFDKKGNLTECCAVGRDITGCKNRSQLEIHDVENRFRTLLDSANDTIIIMDRDRFVDFNKKTLEMFGCTEQQLLSSPPALFWPEYQPDGRLTRDIAIEKVKAAIQGDSRSFELRHRRFDGSLFDTEVSLNLFEYKGKKDLLAIIRDVTERKHTEEIIRQLAYHDTLTGLPNRRLFIDRLETAIALAKRNNRKIALMMFDLDYFKNVNDSYGHQVGDLLLKAVSGRVCLTLRKSDTIGRMGGDEFMSIISFESINKESIPVIAEKILKVFNEPFKCEKRKIKITASIGITLYPDHGDNVNILFKRADVAMYKAKKLGRNRYHVYNGRE